MNDSTPSFLKEVDDALHEERLRQIWVNYKLFIISAIGTLVVGTAVWQGLNAWRAHQAEATADLWHIASKKAPDDPAYAANLQPLADARPVGFAVLARTLLANATPESAATQYDALATLRGAPDWVHEHARFNQALAMMETDTAAAKALLTPMLDDGHALRPLAREVLAVIAQNDGDLIAARQLTEAALADTATPAPLRTRAYKRLGGLTTLVR